MAAVGPSPGSTPTSVPISTPMKQYMQVAGLEGDLRALKEKTKNVGAFGAISESHIPSGSHLQEFYENDLGA